jgi:hypothetical protein
MVRDLLGEPDRTARNPRYRGGPPMRLYDIDRVVRVEATPEWEARRAASKRRQAVAVRATEAQRERLLREVESTSITVPRLPLDDVMRRGVASWRDRQAEFGRYVDGDVPPDVAERLAVNYLRHELTAYDDHLAALYRRVGKDAAYDAINEKVYEAISRAYPELAKECDRQVARKFMAA